MERPREGGIVGLVVGVVCANHLALEGTQIMGGLWKGSLRARCSQGIRIMTGLSVDDRGEEE